MSTTMAKPQRSADEQAERKARLFWVSLIVGLLGIQVLIGGTSIYLAVSDPTSAVIPNYYDAAVNWDSTRRARELTIQLGWKIMPVVSEPTDGRRSIQIQVLSPGAEAVGGLNMSASIFHHARGSEIYQLRFQEVARGLYRATTTLTQAGLWQMDLQLEGDHGIAAQSRELLVQ